MTMTSIALYLRTRANRTQLQPDVRAWFADAATIIEALETPSPT